MSLITLINWFSSYFTDSGILADTASYTGDTAAFGGDGITSINGIYGAPTTFTKETLNPTNFSNVSLSPTSYTPE